MHLIHLTRESDLPDAIKKIQGIITPKKPVETTRRGLILAACGSVLGIKADETAAAPSKFSLSGTIYESVGRERRVDPMLIYAITCVESAVEDDRRRGRIRPYPWTLRSDKGPFYGKDKEDAVRELQRLLAAHRRQSSVYPSIDVGLAQVNLRWHGHRVRSVFDLLDPKTNLGVAADILNECFARHPRDAFRAIGSYHSADESRALRYAARVVRVYSALR